MFLAPPVLDLSCIRTFGSSFGMFLALPVLDLSCILTLDLHFGMFLAPPVLDLSCIHTLYVRLLCFCSHFVDQAIDLVSGLYRCATFSSSNETSRRNGAAQHILLALIFVV